MPLDDKYTASDIINFAAQQKPADVADALNNLMLDKIHSEINDRKLELAKSLFGGTGPSDEEEYEDDEIEDDADYEDDSEDDDEEEIEYEDDFELSDEELEELLNDIDDTDFENDETPEADLGDEYGEDA